jgi:hypothetical protein
MESLNKVLLYILARAKEPSTWAALGALLMAYGVIDAERWAVWLGVISALIGVGMPERGNAPAAPPAPPPVTEKPEAAA